ncbi:MAG: DUF2240 family protein [Euryarchaeota archaeon]|nr:DUF2240 family protein [Euryarchaeota archaeon]MBU4491194.1 DUF2240 family protein [Euryarchaeota archaeon]MCG2728016.1 DUF2240 family protein [Candidatus Methanoperedenaceae archaeon]
MSDLIYTVSMPFLRKGKEALKESEFVLALSIDLNWFAPEQAKNLLNHAEKSGLMIREGELIHPAFDISKVEIPSGFKPELSIFEKKAIFDRIIERIISGTGMEKRKVIALINKKQEELAKTVVIEVSAILVALEHGVMMDDLIEEEYEDLISPLTSKVFS